MNDFKKQYYINNIPWKKYINYDKITKFRDIRYSDSIVFNYDLQYSMFKLHGGGGVKDKTIFISAINICFRYYQILKNLYPYNKIYINIYVKNSIKKLILLDVFKSVIDIIPNFALVLEDNKKELEDILNNSNYKNIVYGYIIKSKKIQCWSVINGRLIIKKEEE